MLNFVYLRSSRLNFSHFWLDSCIVNKGEKFELEIVWMHLEGFRWFQAISRLWCAPVWPVWPVEVTGVTGQSVGPVHILHTGQTGRVDRSDRSGLGCCSCPVQVVSCMHSSRGSCIGSGGALYGFSSFGLVDCAFCLSIVLSRMCRAIALA
jgi:hypothetical protein